jgi:RNA polymerase sigma-70 factor (ECF subfamily)
MVPGPTTGKEHPDPPDAELLARFHDGEPHSLDVLFDRYETPLYCFLLGILRDPHQAEDTLQETFVRALERLDGVDPDHLRGWLFTVAYHQAMLLRRREAGRRKRLAPAGENEPAEARDPLPGPGELLERDEDAHRLRALLAQLPPAQQEVIRQRVYEGKKFREIAEDLDCPLNTALARMHEGLKRLRLMWGESHG